MRCGFTVNGTGHGTDSDKGFRLLIMLKLYLIGPLPTIREELTYIFYNVNNKKMLGWGSKNIFYVISSLVILEEP